MTKPYLAVLFLSSCAVSPVDDIPAPQAQIPPVQERKETPKPKPKPPPAVSTAVQAPVPPPPVLPTVDHCAKLEAESVRATVRAKLDCLSEATRK